jgi:hypothetical protein
VRQLAGGNAQSRLDCPHRAQRPTHTFPEGELFHSPGLRRQRLPVPALKTFRKPVGLRLNAARPSPAAPDVQPENATRLAGQRQTGRRAVAVPKREKPPKRVLTPFPVLDPPSGSRLGCFALSASSRDSLRAMFAMPPKTLTRCAGWSRSQVKWSSILSGNSNPLCENELSENVTFAPKSSRP